MLETYYAIQDISGEKKNLKVVGEFASRPEAEDLRDKLEVRGCEVYAEVGGKQYRVMCEQIPVKSEPKDL